jgi:hypothetical protein
MVKKWKLWQEYYRQPLQAATLHQFENGMYVFFLEHNQLSQKGSLLPGIWKMN